MKTTNSHMAMNRGERLSHQLRKSLVFPLLLLLGLFSSPSFLKAQIITTYAGTGTLGYSGDGGPATAATMQLQFRVSTSPTGVYIGDGNNVIRKVDLSGVIHTVAGTGAYGYTGDGGPATAATFYVVYKAVENSVGDLYITDVVNDVIRKVDHTTGNISTFAGTGATGYSGDGGPAAAATFNQPISVAVDASDNLYIADGLNNVVRKVDAGTGIISTVAGTGVAGYSGDGGAATAATLHTTMDVHIDNSGNLLIVDYANCAVRKVDAGTGIITTICGSGAPGYSGDGGPATAATLNYPRQVAVDGCNNIFIADENNDVIREIDGTTGNIATVVGNGSWGYSGDGGLATAATLNYPEGVAVDAAGNLYVSDHGNNAIREVTGLACSTAHHTCNCCDSLGNFWRLNGNSVSASNFLGSTNAADLVFQTNSTERMRIDQNGNSSINTAPNPPTAILDVNCSTMSWPSGLRFENLPAGKGNILVVDAKGYVYVSKAMAKPGNVEGSEDLNQKIEQLESEINDLKAQLYANGMANTGGSTLSVSPNPTSGQVTAVYSIAGTFSAATIRVTDNAGRLIYTTPVKNSDGSIMISLPQGLASGNLLCSLIVDQKVIASQKVTLVRN